MASVAVAGAAGKRIVLWAAFRYYVTGVSLDERQDYMCSRGRGAGRRERNSPREGTPHTQSVLSCGGRRGLVPLSLEDPRRVDVGLTHLRQQQQ